MPLVTTHDDLSIECNRGWSTRYRLRAWPRAPDLLLGASCFVADGHFNELAWLRSNFSIVVNPPICDTAANGMWEGGPPSLQTLCRQYLHYELDKTYQDGQLAPETDVCGDAAVRGNRRPGTPSAAGCDDRSDACPRLGLRLGDVDSLRLRGGDVRNLFFVLCSLSGHIF